MREIADVKANGYNVISTFSGCGGSCLGFKMNGYSVLWANEFVPEAAKTYQANHPRTILNTDDIRKITPEQIRWRLGKRWNGEIDVLEGSPPCSSFSTSGSREAGWGSVKKYSDVKQRTDDLFFEFCRLLAGLKPRVFVAENVSGLVKGTAKGYFKEILAALGDCCYDVEARLVDAQWLGVPQARQRMIFVGVRKDLVKEFGVRPAFPKPLPYRYTISDALPWIRRVKLGDEKRTWARSNRPSPTIVQSDAKASDNGKFSGGGFVEAECDISKYAIAKEWDRLELGEKGRYLNFIKPKLNEPCPTVTQTGGNTGAASVVHPLERRKFSIAELKQICAFPPDFQLTGTFAQQWERLGRSVPPVMMAAIARTVQTEILDRCRS